MIARNGSIVVTPRSLANLRIARLKAQDAGKHSFVFEGNELDVRFAGHLLDYMGAVLAQQAGERDYTVKGSSYVEH